MQPQSKLFAALSKAQGQVDYATKSQKNEAFKKDGKASKYADIADVIEVIKKPALDNGLSVTFNFKSELSGDRFIHFIKYVVRHESGEAIDGDWVLMMLRDNTMHGFGAGNTYYRRQLLKAIYQIPEEDDDGNSQSLKPQPPPLPKAKPKNHAPSSQQYQHTYPQDEFDQAMASEPFPDHEGRPMSLLEELYALTDEMQITGAEAKDIIKRVTGKNKSTELNDAQVQSVITYIRTVKK